MGAERESDEIKSVSLDLVGDDEPRHAGGRPRKLTVAKFLKICSWIEKGRPNIIACKNENINYSGFRFHIRTRLWWRKRYEIADTMRDEYFRDVHLANIIHHSQTNWTASAWLLERKFPHLFGMKNVNRDTAPADKPIGNEIPAERLAHYGEMMLQLAEEDRAREAAKAPRLAGVAKSDAA
jgi:hypothetical protein